MGNPSRLLEAICRPRNGPPRRTAPRGAAAPAAHLVPHQCNWQLQRDSAQPSRCPPRRPAQYKETGAGESEMRWSAWILFTSPVEFLPHPRPSPTGGCPANGRSSPAVQPAAVALCRRCKSWGWGGVPGQPRKTNCAPVSFPMSRRQRNEVVCRDTYSRTRCIPLPRCGYAPCCDGSCLYFPYSSRYNLSDSSLNSCFLSVSCRSFSYMLL